ncbi:MAG TPA: hypothetical protein ENK16_04960, partial [Chromatiales bacterium]|nr:hypothetical protein [Chromatiales bacterium]
SRCLDRLSFEEQSAGGRPWLCVEPDESHEPGGFVRLWAGQRPIDRMVRVQLHGPASGIHLFFVFGSADTQMPHFHLQIVQIGESSCVYNVDLLPRLDPVDHPGYYEQVFFPLNIAYWKATQDRNNACASAVGNPAVAAYLSPWGIAAGRPTDSAELDRVGPRIHDYLDHYLSLAGGIDYPAPDAGLLRTRNERHLRCFFDEKLDPRAWKGLYRLAGRKQGGEIRRILMQELG